MSPDSPVFGFPQRAATTSKRPSSVTYPTKSLLAEQEVCTLVLSFFFSSSRKILILVFSENPVAAVPFTVKTSPVSRLASTARMVMVMPILCSMRIVTSEVAPR
jgi:hypothetical protein